MISRFLRLLVLICAVSLMMAPAATLAAPATPTAAPAATCQVTRPNDEAPPDENDADWYGSGAPNASLWLRMLWDNGTYESASSRFDGITGHLLRFDFHRGEGSGDVTLAGVHVTTGASIDDERRMLLPDDPYPVPGSIVAGLIVPQPGCWEITATDGNDTLTWTVLVSASIDGCAVTVPNGEAPANSPYSEEETLDWHGSGQAGASLWLMTSPSIPIVPFPSFEPRDEGGYSIKTPFWRSQGSGPITLTGERLDAPSPWEPRIDAAWDGYEMPGFIATGIWYPTEGCWRLTATDGNDTLTWTVLVQSPFAGCDITSGAGDDGSLPRGVITGTVRGGTSTPDVSLPADPDDYYGGNGLYVTIEEPVRRYPVDSGIVSETGAISDTFVWYRQGDAEGELSIEVENSSIWFREEPEIVVPSYGTSGLQPSSITFPGPGCWEISGTSGDITITVTVRLEIVPAGGAGDE